MAHCGQFTNHFSFLSKLRPIVATRWSSTGACMHHACVPILLQTTVVSGKENRRPRRSLLSRARRRTEELHVAVGGVPSELPKATSRPGAESREQRGGARRSTTAVHIHIREVSTLFTTGRMRIRSRICPLGSRGQVLLPSGPAHEIPNHLIPLHAFTSRHALHLSSPRPSSQPR